MTHANPHTAMIDRQRLASLRVSEDQEFVRRTARSRISSCSAKASGAVWLSAFTE
jgi:hypothetical protein